MKTLLSLFITAALIFGMNACKSSKETAEKAENEKVELTPGKGSVYREEGGIKTKTEGIVEEAANEVEEVIENRDEANKMNEGEQEYRIIISFISWGAGVDPKARNIMDRCMSENQENTEIEVAFEDMPWGREGEVDFCFTLSELGEEEQESFVDSMKKAFEGNELVQIYENSPAIHKR
ncbi:MAG: hypothetical protein HKN75_03725 [Bacteroidia bacterium]|nr:hypothetical protein [Bacteroidia bacterium]